MPVGTLRSSRVAVLRCEPTMNHSGSPWACRDPAHTTGHLAAVAATTWLAEGDPMTGCAAEVTGEVSVIHTQKLTGSRFTWSISIHWVAPTVCSLILSCSSIFRCRSPLFLQRRFGWTVRGQRVLVPEHNGPLCPHERSPVQSHRVWHLHCMLDNLTMTEKPKSVQRVTNCRRRSNSYLVYLFLWSSSHRSTQWGSILKLVPTAGWQERPM